MKNIDEAYENFVMKMLDEVYREEPETSPCDEELESMQRGYADDLDCTRDNLFDAMCNLTRGYSEKLQQKEI